MIINQRKANRIKGMFATLNNLELNDAIARENKDELSSPQYVFFECDIGYCDIYKGFSCELTSYKMCREYSDKYGKYAYRDAIADGGHYPTTQTLWSDKCSYKDFDAVVAFVRDAIKSGGTRSMQFASHEVRITVPDYLGFTQKETTEERVA
jgi:hypothetical protein